MIKSGRIAQLVERETSNLEAVGSSPASPVFIGKFSLLMDLHLFKGSSLRSMYGV